MKKNISIVVPGLFSGLLFATTCFSQTGQENLRFDTNNMMTSSKELVSGKEADKIELETLKFASTRAYRDFSRHFQNPTAIKAIYSKKNIFISCRANGTTNRILYTSKGRWVHTIKYISPDKLKKQHRDIIEEAFPRFDITSVTEVNFGNKTATLINIETKTLLKTIRVVDEDWDIYKEYKKQ